MFVQWDRGSRRFQEEVDDVNSVKYNGVTVKPSEPSSPKRRRRSGHSDDTMEGDTRRAILDAAVKLFLEHGHEKFSLRQVAREIGYTPTTIYLYFKDKDDLLFHVVIEGFKNFGSMLQAGYDSGRTPIERLVGIGRAYVRFGLENPLHYRLMFMERSEFLGRQPPPGFEAPVNAFKILLATVEECMQSGQLKEADPFAAAVAVWAVVHGYVALRLNMPNLLPSDGTEVERLIYDMVVRGLGRNTD